VGEPVVYWLTGEVAALFGQAREGQDESRRDSSTQPTMRNRLLLVTGRGVFRCYDARCSREVTADGVSASPAAMSRRSALTSRTLSATAVAAQLAS